MQQFTKLLLICVLIINVAINLEFADYSTEMQVNSTAVITEEGKYVC